jgi:hypothetical protein
VFGSHEKNYEIQKSEFGKCRWNLAAVAGFRRESLTGSGRILAILARFGWINSGSVQIRAAWPEFGPPMAVFRHRHISDGLIPATGCCRTPAPIGFRGLTIAKFWRSNIKHACKEEELNFGKRFTVLKIVSRFPKIKEAFTVKPKMIFVDHYFRPYQTSKNVEIIF